MRHILYFSLGFIPSIFFGLRFFIQWIRSEKEKKVHVSPLFWKLSLCGNATLSLHYFIQFQYPLLLIQLTNGFIAWRNLDFIQTKKKKRSFLVCLWILAVILTCGTGACFIEKTYFIGEEARWLSRPLGLSTGTPISFIWHFIGIVGSFLFGIRFWIQWIGSERSGKSELGKLFWIVSIIGSVIALIYFCRILDYISIVNYSFGLIPYCRNLILMKASERISADS